jgi:hypothetical protein
MTQNCDPVERTLNVGEIILGIVRGDLSLSMLTKIGVDLTAEEGSYKLQSGRFDISVTPALSDMAIGILNYSSRTNEELRKWAFFVLAECGAIDLSAIESDPRGQVLIDALWDCSFHGVLDREIVALAEKIIFIRK